MKPYWVIFTYDDNMSGVDLSTDDFTNLFANEENSSFVTVSYDDVRKVNPVDGHSVIYWGEQNSLVGVRGAIKSPYPIWHTEWFDHRYIQKNLGTLYIHGDADVMTVAELKNINFNFCKHVVDGKVFIGTMDKTERQGFQTDFDIAMIKNQNTQIRHFLLDPLKADELVFITSPKIVQFSYSCVVVAGEIAAFTRNARYVNGQRTGPRAYLPKAARNLVDYVNERYQPAPVYVIDVADIGDGRWVVEGYQVFNYWQNIGCADVRAIIQNVNDCFPFSDFQYPKTMKTLDHETDNTLPEVPNAPKELVQMETSRTLREMASVMSEPPQSEPEKYEMDYEGGKEAPKELLDWIITDEIANKINGRRGNGPSELEDGVEYKQFLIDLQTPSEWSLTGNCPVPISEYGEKSGMGEFAIQVIKDYLSAEGKDIKDAKQVYWVILNVDKYDSAVVFEVYEMNDGSFVLGEYTGD